jgi:ATP-binding cassette subfamily B protein
MARTPAYGHTNQEALSMTKPTTSKEATRQAWRSYVSTLWSLKKFSIAGMVLPGIGNVFVAYLPPLVVAAAITHFGNERPTLEEAVPYLLTFAGVWFVGEIIWRIAFLFLNVTDSRGISILLKRAMAELHRKDIGFFHDNFAGALTKKVIGYGKSFESFVDTFAFNIMAQLIPLGFASVILWRYSPWLVLTLVVLITVVLCIIVPLTRKRKKLVDLRETASNVTAGHVADTIGNMEAVQAFAHHDFEQAQHIENVDDYMRKAKRSWDFHTLRVDTAISPFYVLINVVGLALAIMLSDNASTTAAIFVTFNYFTLLTRILWEFNRIYRNLENAISEASQFTELLLEAPAIQEAPDAKPLAITKGAITFDHVHFAYENRADDPLFDDFNLHIPAGQKLALVGHSGGGKTSVTKLLLRFKDISGGQLLIDGQDIRQGRIQDLREAIAYVPQEPAMFHRSIRENIRYGKLDATDEEVIAAAKKAHAHEFIKELPEGYETMVGERGVKLSGGQRQRIAIARAIIKDAPILVLDEATSALDSESEKLIQDALWKLMQGRTAIVIAHRLSTIQRMDRIVVLDHGTIAEEGTHKELVTRKQGTYAQLWAHQSGGFLED